MAASPWSLPFITLVAFIFCYSALTVDATPTYTIVPTHGATLVNIAGFTAHQWNGDDDLWALSTPFPVVAYGHSYSSIGVSSNAHIQFDPTNDDVNWINDFPSTNFATPALLAFMIDMRTDINPGDDIRSGTIGSEPHRTFVVDWQGGFYSNHQAVRFQVLFREDSPIISLIYGIGSNFKAPLTDPDSDDRFFVGIQQSGDGGLYTRYEGDLTDFLQLDFDPTPALTFDGIPTQPLLIPRGDIAVLSLLKPNDLNLTATINLTLTCESPTAATRTFPLRLCPISGEIESCVTSTNVEFIATSSSVDVDFTCSSTVASQSDIYLLPQQFIVAIRLPRLSIDNVPTSALVVVSPGGVVLQPSSSVDMVLVMPPDLELPSSINLTLTCTLSGAPTLTFPLALCSAGDVSCVARTQVQFSTNTDMPSGSYLCVSTLDEYSAASPLYNLPAPITIDVVRPPTTYLLTQSTSDLIDTTGFTDHGWSGSYIVWSLDLPFPVRVYGTEHSKVGVSSSGNLQFTKRARDEESWSSDTNVYELPTDQMGTALFAFGRYMITTRVQSGVVGESPNRVFVVDCQGSQSGISYRFQYLLYESGSHLSVIYSGSVDATRPWINSGVAVALQSNEFSIATVFDGVMTSNTRLDYQFHELQFHGVPFHPIRAPKGIAQITLIQPADVEIVHPTNYSLSCTATTSPTNLSFPLRLCGTTGDSDCTPLTVANFSAANVTEPITYTCTTLFVGLTSLVYAKPSAFNITLMPPITTTNEWSLTVGGPAGFSTRVYSNIDAIHSPIELAVQAGERASVGTNVTSLTYWMSGSNCRFNKYSTGHTEPNQATSDDNTPSSRVFAESWSGKDGNLYLYSGSSQSYPGSSDMWSYIRTTGQWSKLTDSTSRAPVYGTRGQSSNETTPGIRSRACSVVDDVGDLWLFGGFDENENIMGDLFKFTVSSGEWTFVAGSMEPQATPTMDQGLGVAVHGNSSGPGGRWGSGWYNYKQTALLVRNAWTNGKIAIFGGQKAWNSNDMWTYDPLVDEWTWLNGGLPGSAVVASFGERGVTSSSNMPPARVFMQMVAAADGKLWMVAGRDSDNQPLADVWSYDIVSGWWTFEGGSETSVSYFEANYGEFRVQSTNNTMPGRYDFAAGIDQHAGVIYVSGGETYYSGNWNVLSDVWSFNISSKIFTWIGGSASINAPGSYPSVQGISAGEVHSGRPSNYGGNLWVDPSGGLWFGMGVHYHWNQDANYLCNDLWYMPSGADVLTIDLAVAGIDSTTFNTPLSPAITRIGRNRWTLGRPELEGTAKDFNFTVVGGTGIATAPFTLRLVQRAASTDNSWSARTVASGLVVPVVLTQVSNTSAGLIHLPTSAAFGNATVTLNIPAGAIVRSTVVAPGGVFSMILGSRGSNSSLTFTVVSESGVASVPFTVTFIVAQFTDNSWSAQVDAPGFVSPITLSHASGAPGASFQLPASAALGTAVVTLTLPDGASVSSDGGVAADVGLLIVTLGTADSSSSLTFTVSAENGVAAAPFTITFVLDAPASTGMPSSGDESSSSSGVTLVNSSTGSAHSKDSSSGGDVTATPSPSPSSTGDGGPIVSSSSSTGSAASSVTYRNATLTLQLNYNSSTIPTSLIADFHSAITTSVRFPAKSRQALHFFIQFVRRSGAARRRRLLDSAGESEVTKLTITFVPVDPTDDGAFKAARDFSAQLKCHTQQCAATEAAAAGVNSIYSSPGMAALLVAVDHDLVDVNDGRSLPLPPPPADESSSSSGLSDGAIAGIVIGVVVGVLVLAVTAIYVVRVKSRSKLKVTQELPYDNNAAAVAELAQLPPTDA